MVGVDLAYSRCGFVVGALAGCTGTGGGALIEPLLIPLFLNRRCELAFWDRFLSFPCLGSLSSQPLSSSTP